MQARIFERAQPGESARGGGGERDKTNRRSSKGKKKESRGVQLKASSVTNRIAVEGEGRGAKIGDRRKGANPPTLARDN